MIWMTNRQTGNERIQTKHVGFSRCAVCGLIAAMIAVMMMCASCSDASEDRKEERDIKKLASILLDEDASLKERRSAAEELGETGSDLAIEPLTEAMKHWPTSLGEHAGNAIAAIGSDAAIEALSEGLSTWSFRKSAIFALQKSDSEKARAALFNGLSAILQDEEASLSDKYYAVEAIGKYYAVEAIGESGDDRAIVALIKKLDYEPDGYASDEEKERYKVIRALAKETLIKIGSSDVIDALLNNLDNQTSNLTRHAAFEIICAYADDTAISTLITLLEKKGYIVLQSDAAEALGQFGGETATTALIAALDKNYSTTVNEEIVDALVSIGSETVVQGLLPTALYHKDEETRIQAVDALIEFSDEGIIAALLEALTNENYLVRSNAAYTLGRLKAEVAIMELEAAALHDEFGIVRGSAAFALGEIGSVSSVPSLLVSLEDDIFSVRVSAIAALGKIGGEDAEDSLVSFLYSEDPQECIKAARALGETGTESAAVYLKNAALGWGTFPQGEEWDDRLFAIADAIGEIGGDIGAYALIEILQQELSIAGAVYHDELFRPYVAKILSEMEDNEAAAKALEKFLNSGDLLVIAGAYQYFIELGRSGSERFLIDALYQYGDKKMASQYLNSGNEKLSYAAERWADAHGYSVTSIPGSSGGTSWGSGG